MKRMVAYILWVILVSPLICSCDNESNGTDFNRETEDISHNPDRKILVAYFSATGNTQRLAEQIIQTTGADAFRIEAADPYASNPYDDSDRIQNESYNNLRPEIAAFLDNVGDYDVIFIGSPIWWHNPAMVTCTFLEHYNLEGKIVIPFFTYGSTTYLQQSLDKIYEVTPKSTHLRTYTGGSVETWLKDIHIIQ